jgi:hypothetical protein
MADSKKLINEENSQEAISEYQKIIDKHKRAANYHEVAALHHHKVAEQLRQDFSNNARGCSVKVQTVSIFEN